MCVAFTVGTTAMTIIIGTDTARITIGEARAFGEVGASRRGDARTTCVQQLCGAKPMQEAGGR
jgi:hypothetical protein